MIKSFYLTTPQELSDNSFWKHHLLGEENDCFILEKRSPTPLFWIGKLWRWLEGTFRLSFLQQKINDEVNLLLKDVNTENSRKLELWSVALPKFQAQVIDVHNQRAWFSFTKIASLSTLITNIESSLNTLKTKNTPQSTVTTPELPNNTTPSTTTIDPLPQSETGKESKKAETGSNQTTETISTNTNAPLDTIPENPFQTPVKVKPSDKVPSTISTNNFTPTAQSAMKGNTFKATQSTPSFNVSPITPNNKVKCSPRFQSPKFTPLKKPPTTNASKEPPELMFKLEGANITLNEVTGVNGKGKVIFSNGDIFDGTFIKGYLQEGDVVLKNGNSYKGKFEDNVLCNGTLTTTEGNVFEGEFHEGILVKGKKTYITGLTEEGIFKFNVLHGHGTKTTSCNHKYVGLFEFGVFRNGKITYPNGKERIIAELVEDDKRKLDDEFEKIEQVEISKLDKRLGESDAEMLKMIEQLEKDLAAADAEFSKDFEKDLAEQLKKDQAATDADFEISTIDLNNKT